MNHARRTLALAALLMLACASLRAGDNTVPSTASSLLASAYPKIIFLAVPEQGFFTKELDFHGIPIKAPQVVSNDALYAAYDRLALELKHLPQVTANLAAAGAQLQIIGRGQVTSDLPDYRGLKGKSLPEYNGLTVDQRTRGLGGLHVSCGEENLLKLDIDRYPGRDICLHEFAHCIRNYGIPQEIVQRFDAQRTRSLAKGLWVGSYAGSNPDEFFAELTMWYFGTHGDLAMTGLKPENGPAGLKNYDPEAYALFDDFYQGRISVSGHSPANRAVQSAPGPSLLNKPLHSEGKERRATLGLEQGMINIDMPDFTLKLVKASQTIAALQPKGAGGFDFTPADQLSARAGDGFYHLGDLTLRVRTGASGPWQDYSTAAARHPVLPLPVSGQALAAADLTPTLPAECPLQITRTWALENGRLALRFAVQNKTAAPVQIGALGIPMVFNNILTGRSLAQAHAACSFSDPAIAQDAGYLQVTRLSGQGPALVVVPDGKTPFEGYQLLPEPMRPSQTFEGMYAWLVHTKAYAENEWRGVPPWNPPTAATLAPGETRTYGVKFLMSDTIRHIEKTLAANARPVAVGIPGYVLPQDQDGKLFLNYASKVTRAASEPPGAITIHANPPTKSGWQAYTLRGRTWGRVRLSLTYANGLKQSISYYVIKPEAQAVADMGRFLTTRQWFVDSRDPFHRSPSVMTYDRRKDKQVTQDSRVYLAGLGDEGGSGPFLAAAMKEFGQPKAAEVAKYEQFVDHVLWGVIQYKDGPNKYGVRKSTFFYSPPDVPGFTYDPSLNWATWASWNKQASENIGRGYNYPHVVAAYWAMYRVARSHPGMVTAHPWSWYLNQAYQTTRFMFSRDAQGHRRVGYVELGLMEGNVFLALLNDLKHERMTTQAATVETLMKERADLWRHKAYPFGSEMPWDSTGQEEVYAWCDYFGYRDKALETIDAITGYMPTLPHWGYNGNARRYWDFLYAGAPGPTSRIERQFHHYGSGLNAIPLLSEYRRHPNDFYLLRVGYGGTMGALTNIDRQGFASAAFHSFPSTLAWDAYSGDYGPNFFGHAINTATYVINHPEFGWQAFGGNLKVTGDWVHVQPLDSFRRRVYIAPRGLWLTLDAGAFARIDVNTRTHVVRVGLSPAQQYLPQALLRVEQPARVAGVGTYRPSRPLAIARDAYVVPLRQNLPAWVELTDAP